MQRSSEEIQKTHDQLVAVTINEVPNPFGPMETYGLVAALDTLCWVLGHEHNTRFADSLEKLLKFLRTCGYEMTDHERFVLRKKNGVH